jgi:hypothetical protein
MSAIYIKVLLGAKMILERLQHVEDDLGMLLDDLKEQCTRLREHVIQQAGYGRDGCVLCGSSWMRSPNQEKVEHSKNCLAYPQEKKEN